MTSAQDTAQCPPQINLPDFHYACNSASDCAIAGDGCRSCADQFVINKRFLKEFDERDQLLRQKYECSVACETCSTKDTKIYCVEKKCTLQAPPQIAATAHEKKGKKRPVEARPAVADEAVSAALEPEDVLDRDDMD
mgnify:CR=1 FL=1